MVVRFEKIMHEGPKQRARLIKSGLTLMVAIDIVVTQMEAACFLCMFPEESSVLQEACLGGSRPDDSDIILS